MCSVRSATYAARRVPSHAGPSPRSAGAPFHGGGGSPGQSVLPQPGRAAGLYPSFQPTDCGVLVRPPAGEFAPVSAGGGLTRRQGRLKIIAALGKEKENYHPDCIGNLRPDGCCLLQRRSASCGHTNGTPTYG